MSDFESKVRIDIDAGEALATIKALQRQISDFHTSLAKGSATANLKSLQMQQSLIDTINATGQYSAQMKTVASSTQAFKQHLRRTSCQWDSILNMLVEHPRALVDSLKQKWIPSKR